MLEMIHRMHVVLNEMKGLDAGYTSAMVDRIFIKEDGKDVYVVIFREKPAIQELEMMDSLEQLPSSTNANIFRFMTKIARIFEMCKGFDTGFTTSCQDKMILEHNSSVLEVEFVNLGEGDIHDFLKIDKQPDSVFILLEELNKLTAIKERRCLSSNEEKRYHYLVDYCR